MANESQSTTTIENDGQPNRAAFCSYCGHPLDHEAVFCPACGTRVEGAVECEDYVYEAFISYRHVSLDREVAVRIQRKLEGFRIPKQLRTEGRPARLGRLFRDEDELPTSASLSDQIRDALKRSRFLIVMCSPSTNESRWVAREVELYSSFHGRDRVRLVLVEGEPEESFPSLLRSRVAYDRSGTRVEIEEEPLAADFRDRSRKHFNTEVLRLAAPLIGCGFDDLRQRIRARTTRLVAAVSSVVATVSLAFSCFSFWQQAQIERNYRLAQINESEFLATEANDLTASGKRMEAIQVALAALPKNSMDTSKPYVPAAQLALESAWLAFPTEHVWNNAYDLRGNNTSLFAISQSGLLATVNSESGLEVRELRTGKLCWTLDAVELSRARNIKAYTDSWKEGTDQLLFAGDYLVVKFENAVLCLNAGTGETAWSQEMLTPGLGGLSMAASSDGKTIAVASRSDSKLRLYDTASGKILKVSKYEDDDYDGMNQPSCVSFCNNDRQVAMTSNGRLFIIDVEGDEFQSIATERQYIYSLFVDGDQVVLVTLDEYYTGGQSSEFPAVSAIEAYDLSLHHLWTYEVEPWDDVSNSSGRVGKKAGQPRTVAVCTVVRPQDYVDLNATWIYDTDQLVCIANNQLLLLDAASGTVTKSLSESSPFLTCAMDQKLPVLFAVTADGDVVVRYATDFMTGGAGFEASLREKQRARFTSGSEIGTVLVTTSSNPDSLEVYLYGSVKEIIGSEESQLKASRVDEALVTADAVIEHTSKTIRAYDSTDFSKRFELSYEDDAFNWDGHYLESFSSVMATDDCLYAYGPWEGNEEGECGTAFFRISLADGTLLSRVAIDRSFENFIVDATSDGSVIITYHNDHGTFSLQGVDYDTGTVTHEVTYDGGWPRKMLQAGGDQVLTIQYDDQVDQRRAVSTLHLVSLTKGENLDCDIRGCLVGDPGDVVVTADRKAIIASLVDHTLVAFDGVTGNRLWTTNALSSEPVHLAVEPATGNIMLQDKSGICQLYSIKDGHVLATSSTAIPPICSSRFNEEGLLEVRWAWSKKPGDYVGSTNVPFSYDGMALISLDVDAFGPVSNMPNAKYVSTDGRLVIFKDVQNGKLYSLPRPTLDELIEAATDTVSYEGYALTDAEKSLYRIGS